MRRLYIPATAVPGAQRAFGADNVPLYDKRGRPVWEMPKPTSMIMHKGVIRVRGKTKRSQIVVPVYRGFDASLVRAVKSSIRRRNRKHAEELANADPKESVKIEIPDDLIEEVTE